MLGARSDGPKVSTCSQTPIMVAKSQGHISQLSDNDNIKVQIINYYGTLNGNRVNE